MQKSKTPIVLNRSGYPIQIAYSCASVFVRLTTNKETKYQPFFCVDSTTKNKSSIRICLKWLSHDRLSNRLTHPLPVDTMKQVLTLNTVLTNFNSESTLIQTYQNFKISNQINNLHQWKKYLHI